MKILIVTTRVPYPPFKGDKLKVYNIAKNLARNNSVHVLCIYRKKSELKDLDNIRALGAEVDAVHHSILSSILNTTLFIFNKTPIQVLLYKSRNLSVRLSEIVNRESPDVVYFHLIRSAQYVDAVPRGSGSLRVLDFTDAVSLYLSRFAEAERNLFIRLGVEFERHRISDYETIAREFDSCFICADTDKTHLLKKGITTKIGILPNGVDTKLFSRSPQSVDAERIIFTGNMPYFPNEDAAVYFAREVMPLIWKSRPSAKFYIVGRKPTRRIKALASKNIFVTGFVENITEEYLKSAVAVAPMRFGVGTLNKVIEAIVLGVPVVATSIATKGLPAEAQAFVQVADTPGEFAQKITQILDGRREGSSKLQQKDFDAVRRMLSWDSIVDRFAGDLEALLNERGQTSRNRNGD